MAADISAPLKVEVQMSVYANNAEKDDQDGYRYRRS